MNSSPNYQNGLRLVDERTVYIACPYRRQWDQDGDTAAFASGLMASIRSWSYHSFASAVSSRPQSDQGIVDTVFDRLQQRIARDPIKWSLDYVEHHQMMVRVAS